MAMTRRALLISNPGEIGEDNYCRGVYVDIKNYKQHLLSAVGGWWMESEIICLDKPTIAAVRLELLAMSAHDYGFIAFSGHGWYSSVDKDRVLQLRKDVHMKSEELSAGLKKGTIIMDCCQKVYHESAHEKRALAMNAQFSKSFSRRTPDGPKCKNLFFEQIAASSGFIVRLISCSQGEVAEDSDERGGRYTGSLFECIDAWTQDKSSNFSSLRDVYSVVAVHECAATTTKRLSNSNQNAVCEKSRSGPYFPMAVFA